MEAVAHGWARAKVFLVLAVLLSMPRGVSAQAEIDWDFLMPPSLVSNWATAGDDPGAYLGHSVASAGDVNGDGYDDLVIGAERARADGMQPGKAFVYLGSSTGPRTETHGSYWGIPDWSATGEANTDYFGQQVSSAGDVNGDGYDDLLVSANGNADPAYLEGKVYLYLGSATGLGATPAWTVVGDAAYRRLGEIVAPAGDVNGDGFDDFLIGGRDKVGTSAETSKAYLYLGSPTGPGATADWTAIGKWQDYVSGPCSLASAGDVNGDGYSDVLLGSPFANDRTGEADLFLGSPTGPSTTSDWTAAGEAAGHYFGSRGRMASGGDVNGDGYDDLIIGTPSYSGYAGKAYLYFGSPTGPGTTPSWTAVGTAAYQYFGRSLSSAGDIDGDGDDDLLIGLYGQVNVYLGSVDGPESKPTWTPRGEFVDGFGDSVATAGDINGDGLADFVIGSYKSDGDHPNYEGGQAYLHFGPGETSTALAPWTATGEPQSSAPFDFLGTALGSGDFNGDGYDDALIAADDYAKKVHVYLGSGTGPGGAADWTAIGSESDLYFGQSISVADVNGDSYDDVLIAALRFEFGGYRPKPLLYLGSPVGPDATPASWSPTSGGGGPTLAGDVNGDGYDDVLSAGEENWVTKVYLHLGSETGLGATEDWSVVADDNFGLSAMASVGDVNGDGYDDFIIGVSVSDVHGRDAGEVRLYLGSPTGPASSPSWVGGGPEPCSRFGDSVAPGGDVNGDGYDDFFVWLQHVDQSSLPSSSCYPQTILSSELYLYLGSPAGPSGTPGWTLETPAVWYNETYLVAAGSVPSAADVNGDGYDDVFVGTWLDHTAGSGAGRASLYLGSPTGPEDTPVWTAVGEMPEDRFGSSTSAGDLNGDGFEELIVGAIANDDAGHQAGKVYVLGLTAPYNTLAGTLVEVTPEDPASQTSPVSVTFDTVTEQGNTELQLLHAGPEPPTGFQSGTPAVYFDLATTAAHSGNIAACFDYSGIQYVDVQGIRLMQYADSGWMDVTTSIDAQNQTICGIVSSLGMFSVFEVSNRPPVMQTLEILEIPQALGDLVTARGTFCDPDADIGQTYTADINWGDGAPLTEGSITSLGPSDVCNGDELLEVLATYPYAQPGVYSVEMTVTDEFDESDVMLFQYAVIYDPSGGFVTGGGWIHSPEGAYEPDPLLVGKASFGFVSKYKKGASVPTGNTEFQFKVADLNFKSTSYEWLVIAGENARYKGIGTINGEGDYKFMLWGGDGTGPEGEDTFRIRIWTEVEETAAEIVTYDNGSDQALAGGSVVIHKPK